MYALVTGVQTCALPFAVIGRDQTGDDIEAGRLAGAVRSEQADDLAAVQRQRHAPEHRPLLEPLAEVLRHEALVVGDELRHRPRLPTAPVWMSAVVQDYPAFLTASCLTASWPHTRGCGSPVRTMRGRVRRIRPGRLRDG